MKTIRDATDPTMPTLSVLHEWLRYDPESGELHWRKSPARGLDRRVGLGETLAGRIHLRGYVEVSFRGSSFKGHRVAWALYHGHWPAECLDHIDGNPANNRITNLRECSQLENKWNSTLPRNNTTGCRGVSLTRGGRYWARLGVGKRRVSLGYYNTLEEAAAIYANTSRKLHGSFQHPSVEPHERDGVWVGQLQTDAAKSRGVRRLMTQIKTRASSGYRGVFFKKKTGKWQAMIGHKGASIYLGSFSSPELASAAYERARKELTH